MYVKLEWRSCDVMVLTWNLSEKRTPRQPTSYAKGSKSNSASYITPHSLSATPEMHSFMGNRYEESSLGGQHYREIENKDERPSTRSCFRRSCVSRPGMSRLGRWFVSVFSQVMSWNKERAWNFKVSWRKRDLVRTRWKILCSWRNASPLWESVSFGVI